MKKLIAILLLAVMMISCIACQASDDKSKDTENERNEADYHPESPDDIVVSEEEQQKGYKIYQGYYYCEGNSRCLYDTVNQKLYYLPQLIGAMMPSDFYEGFSTGDTVRIKATMAEFGRNTYELKGKQIALVSEGDVSDIPAEILEKFENFKL